jgi:hypothetical protein
MGRRFVVRPQCHLEAVTLVAAGLHSRLQGIHRARCLGEPLSKLDLEHCVIVPHRCDSGKDVAGQQPQRELVRVLKNGRVISWQVERLGDRDRRVDGACDVG